MRVMFGVLGPVTAWAGAADPTAADSVRVPAGAPIALKGPAHRAVLARLIVARGRVVPVGHLVDDLWPVAAPEGAVAAVRTFVAALRRALEPDRPRRTPATLLVTEGPGYALRTDPDTVDAWRFERAATAPGSEAALQEALALWRGPAYADFPEAPWARADRARLAELRLLTVERLAEARLRAGHPAAAIPDLDAHVTEHPWREDAWRLLALALYRADRQGDALAVLRRARTQLIDQLGIDPGPALRRLETDILHQSDLSHPEPPLAHTAPLPPDAAPPSTPAAQPPPHTAPPAAHTAPSPAHAAPPSAHAAPPPPHTAPSAAHAAPPSAHAEPAPAHIEPPQTQGGATPAHAAPAANAVWADVTADYDRLVASGARARLDSTVGLLRGLAITGGGGLAAARRHRVAAISAAEELGDPVLTARVIGAYDVPAIWTRSDDEAQAAVIVRAARRTLAALPGDNPAARTRLLATIAVESRGVRDPYPRRCAQEAEHLARGLDDPALLAFALNGVFMQSCHRTGLAPERDAIGAELIHLAATHGLVTAEVLGHLIRLQARSALADFRAADRHAKAADDLAARHELPLVAVFTTWYRAMREGSENAYRHAAALLDGAGMPGLERGLLPLALLCRPGAAPVDGDFGPYEPWTRPLILAMRGRAEDARSALRDAPEPPPDLLAEALWTLLARAAIALDDQPTIKRAREALAPAAGEIAGAASGLLTAGPVADHLAALARAAS
ncbi:BTAD domain-containing putative transcriptional regulator [Actinoplanes sp. NPDC049596]|uniref:AfsR/SARP family transcriptional regulator n=1 Tax=unclassified Actinoplanes TaxID=2626549 RepID=UPI00343B0160